MHDRVRDAMRRVRAGNDETGATRLRVMRSGKAVAVGWDGGRIDTCY